MGACVSSVGTFDDPGIRVFLWGDGPSEEYACDIDEMLLVFRAYQSFMGDLWVQFSF